MAACAEYARIPARPRPLRGLNRPRFPRLDLRDRGAAASFSRSCCSCCCIQKDVALSRDSPHTCADCCSSSGKLEDLCPMLRIHRRSRADVTSERNERRRRRRLARARNAHVRARRSSERLIGGSWRCKKCRISDFLTRLNPNRYFNSTFDLNFLTSVYFERSVWLRICLINTKVEVSFSPI